MSRLFSLADAVAALLRTALSFASVDVASMAELPVLGDQTLRAYVVPAGISMEQAGRTVFDERIRLDVYLVYPQHTDGRQMAETIELVLDTLRTNRFSDSVPTEVSVERLVMYEEWRQTSIPMTRITAEYLAYRTVT